MNVTEFAEILNLDISEQELLACVEAEREEISPVIGLETMKTNLLNAAELLMIVNHAMEGSDWQRRQVNELNFEIDQACRECFYKVRMLCGELEMANQTIERTYSLLHREREDDALDALANFKGIAELMNVEMDSLCKIFEKMKARVGAALSDFAGERSEANWHVQSSGRNLAVFSAKNDSLTAMKERYNEAIARYWENYDAESAAENRQFTLDMTSIFTGMISSITKVIPDEEEIFKIKHELEHKRVENLEELRDFAEVNSRLIQRTEGKEMAEQMLNCAKISLQQAVNALGDTRAFWSSVSEYCERLDSEQLKSVIRSDMEITAPEIRREFYSSSMFQREVVRFLCQWYAIYQMCEELAREGRDSIEAIRNNQLAPYFSEELRIAANQKATLFLKEIDEEIEASKKKLKKLDEEKKRLGYREA